MGDTTNKEMLEQLIKLQKEQSKDITEIKTCLIGDEYHPNGLIRQVKANTDCIGKIKKQTGMIGGGIAFLTIIGTTIANWFIFKNHS